MEPGEYDNIARLEDRHWWYLGMRAIARGCLRHWVFRPAAPAHAAPPRLLDAGCGTGGGLRWLAEFGRVTGIDYSPLAIHFARQASRQVAQASIQAIPFASRTFDGVTSFEVLYHLAVADDVAALGEIRRVLRPGGWLLLRVPAHDWLRGAHDRQVHTRQRYSRGEVRRKLTAAGFEVLRLSYVGLALLAPAALRRLTEPADRPHTDVNLPAPWLNALLARLLGLEGPWLARFPLPAGLSLMALARRPLEEA